MKYLIKIPNTKSDKLALVGFTAILGITVLELKSYDKTADAIVESDMELEELIAALRKVNSRAWVECHVESVDWESYFSKMIKTKALYQALGKPNSEEVYVAIENTVPQEPIEVEYPRFISYIVEDYLTILGGSVVTKEGSLLFPYIKEVKKDVRITDNYTSKISNTTAWYNMDSIIANRVVKSVLDNIKQITIKEEIYPAIKALVASVNGYMWYVNNDKESNMQIHAYYIHPIGKYSKAIDAIYSLGYDSKH